MARPPALSASELLRALQPAEKSASALAQTLGASRSTVHRLLSTLAEGGLVVRTQPGPRARWRLPTPQDSFQRAQAQRRSDLVRLSLPEPAALSFCSMLELYARLCLGQWEEIVSLARWEALRDATGRVLSADELKELQAALDEAKQDALGLSRNASWGIYSPALKESTRLAWQVYKAVRHRLAWDRRPEGGVGVTFDEPLGCEIVEPLEVYSLEQGGDRQICVEMAAAHLEPLARALEVAHRVQAGDLGVLLEIQESAEALSKEAPTAAQLQRTRQRLGAFGLTPALNVHGQRSTALAGLFVKFTQSQGAEEGAFFAQYSEGGRVHTIDLRACAEGPLTPTLKDLPASMLIGYDRGKYRIVGPGQDGHTLVILGESRSLQTAVLMARNAAACIPLRSINEPAAHSPG